MNPLDGLWIANIEKSRRHENHQFQSAQLRFAVSGNQVSLTQSGVNMSGKEEASTLTLVADGEEYPVSPQAPDVVVISKWIRTHALEMTAKRGEAVIGHGTYEVAADGQTLTATVAGVDGQGKSFEQVIVFDRGES